jgi:RNA polymerase sigma-54 factor
MRLNQSPSVGNKTKLSQTLKSWFPVLMANIQDLEEIIKEHKVDNPIIDVKSKKEESFSEHASKNKNNIQDGRTRRSSEHLEKYSISSKSIYEVLDEQICYPVFPTPHSQDIAYEIIKHITNEGYFDGDIGQIAQKFKVTSKEVEKIRLRFEHCEPVGICANNLVESFKFQLNNIDTSQSIYKATMTLVENLEDIYDLHSIPYYKDAIKTIKSFRNPPAIDFLQNNQTIIPDIIVSFVDEKIVVNINNDYYPDIIIDTNGLPEDNDFVKKKVQEARNLVDAMQMRKSTLHKIGLMIVEYQYEYFMGGEIKPLKLKDLAEEFGYNPSTISRAIANKFLDSHMGLISLKNFFSTKIDDGLSNSAIKNYVVQLVKAENRKKPLSDLEISVLVEKKYGYTVKRRTISKYRYTLKIASSSHRKKEYLMNEQ